MTATIQSGMRAEDRTSSGNGGAAPAWNTGDGEVRVPPPSEIPPPVHESLKDQVVGAALWGAGLSWLIPVLGGCTVLYRFVPPDRVQWLERLYCKVQVALTGARWRAVVHPDVDPDQPYMFAQNHTNHLDHVVLYNATPHLKQGLELETHFKYPFYGWYMKARGTVPVPADKNKRYRGIVKGMKREVENGHSLLVFPEGTRTITGRVGPFKKGVFFAARNIGVPVVPVAVTGMYDVQRKGSWVLHPGKTVTVYVEKPVPMAGLSNAGVMEAMEHVRSVISARVDAYFDEGVGRT